MSLDKVPGLSIGYYKDGTFRAEGFGFADLENKIPARAESAYRLASITKTITAMAVLILWEEGKIGLDREVQEYVPYFPKKKWPVRVRQLLGHLGGISHYQNYDQEGHIKIHKNTREALDIFKHFDLVAEPGTEYHYSSYGFNLLGAAVEGASGQTYGTFIKKNIFEPLGMKDSRMDDPTDLIPHRVRGYRIIDGSIKNSEFVDVSSRFAGGGTRSTVVDLLKYAKGIIEGRILDEDTYGLMFTSMSTREGTLTGYGLGWGVRPWNGHFQVSHGGSQPETRTHLLIFPTENFALAAASNREGLNLIPYITRLAEVVLEEDLVRSAYVDDKTGQAVYGGCGDIFSYGLSRFDWMGGPLVEEGTELEEAFAFFEKTMSGLYDQSDFLQARDKMEKGIHPLFDRAWVKIGTYMADELQKAKGKEGLKAYRKTGPLFFFRDFIEISRKQREDKEKYRFPETFENMIELWTVDWSTAYSEDISRWDVRVGSDFPSLGRRMKQTFRGRSIYPDFSEELKEAAWYVFDEEKIQKAHEIFSLTADLYPLRPGAYTGLAAVKLWEGDTQTAARLYEKARSLDPEGKGARLNEIEFVATKLRDAKKAQALFALAEIALELYPDDADLQKEVGDMYYLTGRFDKAAACYTKALELDPGLEEVRKKLAGITKKKKIPPSRRLP